MADDVYIKDDFTDTAGTDLTAHKPVIGQKWYLFDRDTASIRGNINASNRLQLTSATLSSFIIFAGRPKIPTDEYTVKFTIGAVPATGNDDPVWLLGRMTDRQNLYGAGVYGDGTINIFKKVGGVNTSLASGSVTLTPGDTFTFEIRDTVKRLLHNGTEVLTTSDNALNQTGMAGIGFGEIFVSGNDTNTEWEIDDFEVVAIRQLIARDTFRTPSLENLKSRQPSEAEFWVAEIQSDINEFVETKGDGTAGPDGDNLSDGLLYLLVSKELHADQESELTVKGVPSSGTDRPIILVNRFRGPNDFYSAGSYPSGAAADKKIFKRVGGVDTEIASGDSGLAVDDVLTFQVIGDTLKLFKNGVEELSVTDTDLADGERAGVGWGNLWVASDDIDAELVIGNFDTYEVGGGSATQSLRSIELSVEDLSASGSTLGSAFAIVPVDTDGGAVTVGLPAARTSTGRVFFVSNTGSSGNNVTINPEGAETIDGAASKALTDGQAAIITSIGGEWRTLGEKT